MLKATTRQMATCAIVASVLAAAAQIVKAHTSITVEAIGNDYYGDCPPLPYSIPNVDNFRTRMQALGLFTNGLRWTEGNVLTNDFKDPEKVSGGQDSSNFDRSTDVISYFHGHGDCNNSTSQVCTSAADCPTMTGYSKACIRYQESPLKGKCFYDLPRTLFTTEIDGCHPVTYTNGKTALGESGDSGSWAGAGTNGDINVAVIDNSCGVTPSFNGGQILNMFAGVSMINFIMPTRRGADAINVSTRGKAWADRYVANDLSAVGPMWADAINGVTGGDSCTFGGGGHGINGCGAYISFSVGVDASDALYHNRNEQWVYLDSDINDVEGTGSTAFIFACNYDCNTHPWKL